jgi:hypothetical protein
VLVLFEVVPSLGTTEMEIVCVLTTDESRRIKAREAVSCSLEAGESGESGADRATSTVLYGSITESLVQTQKSRRVVPETDCLKFL